MPSIDLNCDLGESFGAYTIGMDAEILPYVTSANIACGFHAGDPSVMQKSVLLYNMAARDPVLAAAICRAVQAAAPGAVLLALSGSEMVKAANAIGLPVASEVFADRG